MRKMLMFYILLGLLSITASQNLCKEQGYPEGRYGPHCSTTCSEGCFDTCDPISGACSCKPGWFSLKCQERCSPNCHGGLCEETIGTCVECGPGKWGAFCQYNCSFNCKDSECSRKEGTCRCEGMSRMDRCQIRDISTDKPVRMSSRSPSYYLPRRITDQIRECDPILHICTEEEANPWLTIDLQGLHIIHEVNLVLPDNYREKAVARALEILVGNDSFATNNKTTVGIGVGYSVSCQPPILGSHVTIRRITPHGITKLCVCMVQVIGTRDPNIGCVPGKWGNYCQRVCPSNCDDRRCNWEDDTCVCKDGNIGDRCQTRESKECRPGKWGVFCQYHCSFNCKGSECSREEGTCRCEGMSRMDRCQIRDISTGKPVRMSSRSPSSYSPRRITYPIRNCSHLLHICTEEEANPWLTIDLQGLHIIHKVNLVLPDNYRGKAVARALEILVGNDSFATNNKTTVGDGVGYSVSFQPPILGSHVTIRRMTPHGITKLCVCMVQVIGTRDPNIGCVPGKWGNYCQRDCPFNCNDSRCNWKDDTCECKDGNIGDRCQTRESNAPGLSVGISIVIGLVVAGAVICTLIAALYCKCRHRKRTWHFSEEDENELK